MNRKYQRRFKDKFIKQIVICLIIYAGLKTIGMLDFNIVKETEAKFREVVTTNYTTEEIKIVTSDILEEVKDAKDFVSAAVIKANEMSIEGN